MERLSILSRCDLLDTAQSASAVTEAFGLHAQALEKADVEIAHGIIFIDLPLAWCEVASTTASQNDRQVAVAVAIGITNATTKDDHGVIQQASITIWRVC